MMKRVFVDSGDKPMIYCGELVKYNPDDDFLIIKDRKVGNVRINKDKILTIEEFKGDSWK